MKAFLSDVTIPFRNRSLEALERYPETIWNGLFVISWRDSSYISSNRLISMDFTSLVRRSRKRWLMSFNVCSQYPSGVRKQAFRYSPVWTLYKDRQRGFDIGRMTDPNAEIGVNAARHPTAPNFKNRLRVNSIFHEPINHRLIRRT